MSFVWYVGYGSNLHEQRFLCYIIGGTPLLGRNPCEGCKDKSLPRANKKIVINHSLYFALPDGKRDTSNWGNGGVAFIDPHVYNSAKTYCRMWKITSNQYEEIRLLEGPRWYDQEIRIGEDEGIPIFTLTHSTILPNIIRPSASYIKTISLGLRESYGFSNDEIVSYLCCQKGIDGILKIDELSQLIHL